MEALAEWTADRKLEERQQEAQQARAAAVQEQLIDDWQRRLDLAKADLADFDEVVGKSEIDMPNHLYFAIVESDVGPQLAYYFAKNPDEARLLKGMSPTAALRTLGKLEDRLLAEQATAIMSPEKKDPAPAAAASAQKTPEVSKAPPPIDPLRDASTPVEKPTSQMTFQEYKAHRAAQQAARRR
jgi:hypothetical protein